MSDGAIVRLMAICARGFEGANGEELPPVELSLSRAALMDAQYAANVEYGRMCAELSGARRAREKAVRIIAGCSPNESEFGSRMSPAAEGAGLAAREILEAFDGE